MIPIIIKFIDESDLPYTKEQMYKACSSCLKWLYTKLTHKTELNDVRIKYFGVFQVSEKKVKQAINTYDRKESRGELSPGFHKQEILKLNNWLNEKSPN